MTSIIEQINTDQNKKEISLLELQTALEKGLLKDENDIKAFVESIKSQEKEIANSCANSLKRAFESLKKKPQESLTQQEVKIMLLYYRIVEGKSNISLTPIVETSYVDATELKLSPEEQQKYIDNIKALYLKGQRDNLSEVVDSQPYRGLTKFIEYSSVLQTYLEGRRKDSPIPVEGGSNTTSLSGKEYIEAYNRYQLNDGKIAGAIKALQDIISQAQEFATNPDKFKEKFMQGSTDENKEAFSQYLQQQRFDINGKVISGIEDMWLFQAPKSNSQELVLKPALAWFTDMNTDTNILYSDLYATNTDTIFETTMSDMIAEKTVAGLKKLPALHDAQTSLQLPSEWNLGAGSMNVNVLASFLDCADSSHEYKKQSALLQTMGVEGIEDSPLYDFHDMYKFAEGNLKETQDRSPRAVRMNSIKKSMLLSIKESVKTSLSLDTKVKTVLNSLNSSPYLEKNENILCNQLLAKNPQLQELFGQYEKAYKDTSTEALMQYRSEVYSNAPEYKERTFTTLGQQKILAFLGVSGVKKLTPDQEKTVQDIAQKYGESGRNYDIAQGAPVFSQADCDAIKKDFGVECSLQQLTGTENWQDIYNYLETNKMMLLANIAQQKLPRGNMAALFDVLEENTLGMPKPKGDLNNIQLVNTFNKIEGIGSYVSDKNVAFAANLTKTIAIQVALCYVSGGLANLGTKALMAGGARLLATSEASLLASTSEKILAYYADTKSLSTMAKLGVGTADLVVEGSLFHGFNSILSGNTADLTNLEGYIHSIAYMGVMKAFSIPRGANSEKIRLAFEQGKIGEVIMRKGLDLPLEALGMAGTDQVINIIFQGEPMDMNNPEYWVNLVGMVLGLRLAHSKIGGFQKGEKIIVEKMGTKLEDVRIRIESTKSPDAFLRDQLKTLTAKSPDVIPDKIVPTITIENESKPGLIALRNKLDKIIREQSMSMKNIVGEALPIETAKLRAMEKSKQNLDRILSGNATLDDYTGIRKNADVLGLDIEKDLYPLTKKVLENTIRREKVKELILEQRREKIADAMKQEKSSKDKKVGMNANVTDKDIDLFMKNNPEKVRAIEVTDKEIYDLVNKQIDVDGVLERTFGAKSKEQAFEANKSLDQQIDMLIDSFSVEKSELLNEQDRITLKEFCKQHISAMKSLGGTITDQKIFDLMQHNIRKLIYQNVADKSLMSGSDHGILHIVQGDALTAFSMVDQMVASNVLNQALGNKLKAMVGQMIVDHDIGYNMSSFEGLISSGPGGEYKKGVFYDATKDHPLFSRLRVEANAPRYTDMFGRDLVDVMKVAMLDHSDVRSVDLSPDAKTLNKDPNNTKALQDILQKLISIPDCMGVTHVDKLHRLSQHPTIMGILAKFEGMKQLMPNNKDYVNKVNDDLKVALTKEVYRLVTTGEIDIGTANAYNNAIEKGIDTYGGDNEDINNPNGFKHMFDFSSYIYESKGVTVGSKGVEMKVNLDLSMYNTIVDAYGNTTALSNLIKLIGSFQTLSSVEKNTLQQEITTKIKNAKSGDIIPIEARCKDGSLITFKISIDTKTTKNEHLRHYVETNNRFVGEMKKIVSSLDAIKNEPTIEKKNQKLKDIRADLDMYFSDNELADVDAVLASSKTIEEKIVAIEKVIGESYKDNAGIEQLLIDIKPEDLAGVLPDLEKVDAENAAQEDALKKAVDSGDEAKVVQLIENDALKVEKSKSILKKILEKGVVKTKESVKAIANLVFYVFELAHNLHYAKDVIGGLHEVADKKSNKYDKISGIIETLSGLLGLYYRGSHLLHALVEMVDGSSGGIISLHLKNSLNMSVDYTMNVMKNGADQVKFYGQNIQIFKERNNARESTKTTLEKANTEHRGLLLDEIYNEKIARLGLGMNVDIGFASKWENIKKSIIADPSPSNMQALQELVQSLDPHKPFILNALSWTNSSIRAGGQVGGPEVIDQVMGENLPQ